MLIKNALIVSQDHDRRVYRGDIRIDQGHIVKSKTKPKKVLDGKNWVVLPGFVQTHVHLCQTLFRNLADDLELLDWLDQRIWPMEASHTPSSLYLSAQLGLYELISSGTTCILDMATVKHTDKIFEAVLKSGIRANIGKCLMDQPESTPTHLWESTENALSEALRLHTKWNGKAQDRIRASFAPRFAISCTDRLLRSVSARARELGAIIHTHGNENRTEVEWIKKMTGVGNVEYLHALGLTSSRLVMAHGIWLNDREKEILRDSGAHITHCPSSNLKLASGIAPIPKYLDYGINVGLGADGAPCNNHLDMFHEMRLAALIHKPQFGPKAMPAQTILDLATRNGARALGWLDDIGSIEEGKKADLIALDLQSPTAQFNEKTIVSSLVYSAQASDLVWSMVDGKFLFQNGKVATIDKVKIAKAAALAQKEILNKFRNWPTTLL